MKPLCAIAVVFVSSFASSAVADQPAGFRWVEESGESITLIVGSQPVIEYVCAPYDDAAPETRFATCKVYHHVYDPNSGVRLTKGDVEGLYPHHRGLFYGFNKVTYGDGRECDIWHCKAGAYQSHEGVVEQHADAESASQTLAIDWHGADGEVFAHERRTAVVRRRDGGMQIDWSSHLETADGKAIHLDGDPQHAGFHFRAAQEVADETAGETYYVRTDGRGKPGETRNWEPGSEDASDGAAGSERAAMNAECTDRPWNAMSIVVGGQRYTILYLDAPDNPKPARYSERDYGRFGSYFVRDVTLQRPLDVRYRVWVQPGEMTVDECVAKYREFAGER